jgi:hypothetical protein
MRAFQSLPLPVCRALIAQRCGVILAAATLGLLIVGGTAGLFDERPRQAWCETNPMHAGYES